MPSRVTMMIGLPGSGKSTWALNYVKEHPEENIQIYSSDFYRLCMFGDENDQTHNNEVFKAMYEDIKKSYAEGNNIIIDATNLTYKDRERTRNSLRGIPITRCVIVATPVKTCIQRDASRKRTVGQEVIKRCACKFEIPLADEFNEITIVGGGNYTDVSTIMEQMCHFEQHNPHHIYPVGIHCQKVASQFESGTILYKAATWHDVGKMFTQTFDEKGVGHYYQHANYSAYFMLCYCDMLECDSLDEVLEVLFYINQHMHIRDILKSSKAIKKYKTLWGEERFNNLVALMTADNIGSGTSNEYEIIKKGLT